MENFTPISGLVYYEIFGENVENFGRCVIIKFKSIRSDINGGNVFFVVMSYIDNIRVKDDIYTDSAYVVAGARVEDSAYMTSSIRVGGGNV